MYTYFDMQNYKFFCIKGPMCNDVNIGKHFN